MNVGVSGVGLGFTILDEVEIQPLKDGQFAAWIIYHPKSEYSQKKQYIDSMLFAI